MKCCFCNSDEELKWPENYKPHQRPVNAEHGGKHVCLKGKGFVHYNCPKCNLTIWVNPKKLDLSKTCGECSDIKV